MSLVQVTLGVVGDWTSQVRITVEFTGTLTDPGEMVTMGRGTGDRERERQRQRERQRERERRMEEYY